MRYFHADVFSSQPYSGNSLAVFPDAAGLTADQMGRITRELRHFESIFLFADGEAGPGFASHQRHARVFDLIEELDFAGHPVLGAACVLHELHGGEAPETWTLRLAARTVQVTTERRGPGHFSAVLDQGPADFVSATVPHTVPEWFGLDARDLDPDLPPQVVSTGLRYLIVPVRTGALERARITAPDLAPRLEALGAQFAYLLDPTALEGRHWNNDGLTEDVATGSAAGCVAAYLRRHRRLADAETATLHQGRFLGRPSTLTIRAHGTPTDIPSVEVGGDVVLIGAGSLDRLPR